MTGAASIARAAFTQAAHAYANFNSLREARAILAARARLAPLRAADRRRADDYAREVLGSRSFAPWLHVYASVAGGFREGWIPDNFYARAVIPRLKAGYSTIALLKTLSGRLLATPCLPDVAYLVRHRLYDRDYRPLADLRAFREEGVVFKADISQRGQAVRVFAPDDAIDFASLPNGVFQPFIRQHEELAALGGAAVATLRLTTVIEPDGRAGLRAAFIRFGRAGEDHVGSATHICASVGLTGGDIQDTGFLPSWLPVERHPDTGMAFAGREVPAFADCARVALALQEKVPFVPCVGWDFAVDRQGTPVLMEWNGGHNGIKFSEATVGPCFTGLGWEALGRAQAPRM